MPVSALRSAKRLRSRALRIVCLAVLVYVGHREPISTCVSVGLTTQPSVPLPLLRDGHLKHAVLDTGRGFKVGSTNPLLRWASPFYALLMALALIAFWPGYLAVPKPTLGGWLHFHAVSGALWMLMLIAQPWAIQSGRRKLHVYLGRASLLLAPLVLVGFVGLAHSSMQGKSPQGQAIDAYFFYIRVVLVTIFVTTFVMGMVNRRRPAFHSRYMMCTGLPLIDPVVHRIAQRAIGGADLNYQLLTFGVVGAILAMLILAEWNAPSARRVFPIVLAAFILGGLPLALDFHTWGAPWTIWKSLSSRFAALPLT